MKNKLYERRAALEAALHTVTYQIDNLQPYYNNLQIRCWKRNRRTIKAKLKTIDKAIRIHEAKPKRERFDLAKACEEHREMIHQKALRK
jgi:hypothetical protein